MKTSHRHDLKTNELAQQLARTSSWLSEQGARIAWVAVGVVILAVAIGVFVSWRQGMQEEAGAALADALIIADAQIAPPGSGEIPPPGTYATEQARSEAALERLNAVIQQFPSTDAATTARFRAGMLLVGLGKTAEAAEHFRQVMANDRGIHGRMARMALAELQVRDGAYDEPIATYRDLADGGAEDLPVDGVLMQLGRVYQLAGKNDEALQTYQRIIDEFPDSVFVTEARRATDTLKAGTVS